MRKLVKKYLVGGGLTSPTYTPSYNTGTDLYNQITNRNFNSLGNQFSNEILKGPLQNDEIFKNKVQYNTATENTLKNLSGITSSMIGASKNFTKGKGLFSKENIGGTMQIAGQVADMLGSFLPEKNEYSGSKGNITRAIDTGYDAASDIAMSINPLIGGAMKVGGFVSDGINAITGGTDGMTATDAIFGSTLGNLLGVGIINSAFGKKADTMYKDNATWEQQGSSYGGSLAKVDDAMTKSGKKYGAFSGKGRRAANRQIAEAKRQQGIIQGINNEAQDAFLSSNNSQTIGLRNQMDLNGVNWNKIHAAKEGLKLDRDFAQKVVKLSKGKKSKVQKIQEKVRAEEVAEFKNGGTVNVIPDGALHKNKHHLENVDEKFEDVTAKGIPVITESAGGDITQHAEVEREEIIFNLDVTKQLEKLMEDGSDEAAIEAGKLLVHEILENTVDNTGLLNKVE